jgi:eukaryotic-like serine/threonine-protein kinase
MDERKEESIENTSPGGDLTSLATIAAASSSRPESMIAGRFRLMSQVGVGGMGQVFKAWDTKTDSLCAVKVMHNHLRDNESNLKRFEREARVSAGLKQENVVSVLDFGVTESLEPYIVMEFIEGRSLADVLHQQGYLTVDQFGTIFTRVCQGLSYAHGAGVVHRDIKPSNIMLVDGDTHKVKIVDFGIARVCKTTGEICPTSSKALQSLRSAVDDFSAQDMELMQRLTQPGEVFGSPLYMSPEQCYGDEADCRSEVYSLGCMMFESLAGTPPLKGRNAMDTVLQRINNPAPSISSINSNAIVPAEIEAIIACCLERSPDDRYQTVDELLAALNHYFVSAKI